MNVEIDGIKPVKVRRGKEVYITNPFLPDLKSRTKRVTNKRGNMALINTDTGEIESIVAGFWESHEVDATKFVKLFVRGVKALKDLTSSGTKMFEVLYHRVQENIGKDKVYMSYMSVDQVTTPMSEATYTRGMRELTEKGFIAADVMQGFYWINPSFIWNGDRIAFVQSYVKTSTTKASRTKKIKSN